VTVGQPGIVAGAGGGQLRQSGDHWERNGHVQQRGCGGDAGARGQRQLERDLDAAQRDAANEALKEGKQAIQPSTKKTSVFAW